MKEPRLRIRIEKCYRVSIVDEAENEYGEDWTFGTRQDAKRCGEKLKEVLLTIKNAPAENPAVVIFNAMNEIGGS